MNSVKIYGNFGSRVPQRAHQASWLRSKREGGQLSESRGARPQVTVDLEYPGVYHVLCLGWAAGLGTRVTLGTPEAGGELIPDSEASSLQRAKGCG